MNGELKVISGAGSPNVNQDKVLLHSMTLGKSFKGAFIKLINTKNKKISLISKIDYLNSIPVGSVALNARTQAFTLNAGGGDYIYFNLTFDEEINQIDDVTFIIAKTGAKYRCPKMEAPMYLAPGYRISTEFGLGNVVKGSGLYKYNPEKAYQDLIMGDFNDAVIVPESVTINVNFCQMGIGGLMPQMNMLIRQVLISRIINQDMRNKYQVKDIKGILLYGPPGTGKTLIARKIGNIIPNSVIKKINGPELSSKFYGESESNIRKIFDEAKGNPTKLHIIIFDEIDAVGRKRGGSGGNHDDKVLTQLLTMIDGLDSATNVLIIGITNRKDVLDSALTRAGRLECHVEIPLPTLEGRAEILSIYLQPLINKKLVEDIDIRKLAKITDGYSGADIESLIGRVKNLALLRNCEIGDNSIKSKENLEVLAQINSSDFDTVLSDFQPTFSKRDDTVQRYITNYPLDYKDQNVLLDLQTALTSVLENENMIKPYLIDTSSWDEVDNIKTKVICCNLASTLNLPYINYISYNQFLGQSSMQNCQILEESYINCLQAERSVLILDSIEDVGDRALNLRQKHIIENPLENGKQLIIIKLF